MSQAQPMPTVRRSQIYGRTRYLTPREMRRLNRKAAEESRREAGLAKPHGATGEQTRRPIVRRAAASDLRGSLATHVAYHCAPCPEHTRPRLHRRPR